VLSIASQLKALNDRQGMNYCVLAAELNWMPREAFCVHLAASNRTVTICLTKNTINQTKLNRLSNFAYHRVQSRGSVYLGEVNRIYK
jgi:hypothetical protein